MSRRTYETDRIRVHWDSSKCIHTARCLNAAPEVFDTIGRENTVGVKSVAAPGALRGWCEALRRFGTFSLADVTEPAIRRSRRSASRSTTAR